MFSFSISIRFDNRLCGGDFVRCAIATLRDLTLTTLDSPFLQYVSSRETFDQQMSSYLETTYVREK